MSIAEAIGHFATFGLVLMMISMGMALSVGDFLRVLAKPVGMILGLIGQIVMLPIAAFAICILLELPAVVAVGLIVLACCPGGATSNAITEIARGDTALSISLTAVSSFITFISAPIIIATALSYLNLDGRTVELPFIDTSIRIFLTTVIPVSLGIWLGAKFPRGSAAHRMKVFYFGFTIVISASILLFVGRRQVLDSWEALIGAASLNVSMMIIAFILASLFMREKRGARSICIEVGLQNISLALVIVLSAFGDLEMLAPIIFYLPIAYVTGFGFAFLARASDSRAERKSIAANAISESP